MERNPINACPLPNPQQTQNPLLILAILKIVWYITVYKSFYVIFVRWIMYLCKIKINVYFKLKMYSIVNTVMSLIRTFVTSVCMDISLLFQKILIEALENVRKGYKRQKIASIITIVRNVWVVEADMSFILAQWSVFLIENRLVKEETLTILISVQNAKMILRLEEIKFVF